MRFCVNDLINHKRKGRAVIRYIGEIDLFNTGGKRNYGGNNVHYGIELLSKRSVGNCNGLMKNGAFVFYCAPNKGMFINIANLSDLQLIQMDTTDDKKENYDRQHHFRSNNSTRKFLFLLVYVCPIIY